MKRDIKILVVDDEIFVLLMVKSILTKAGYNVEVVERGASALVVYRRFKPDLILIDINMPGIDGFEFCQKVKEIITEEETKKGSATALSAVKPDLVNENQRNKKPGIIFLTGSTEKEDIKRAVELNADDYIVKPINKEVLLKKIDKVILKLKDKENNEE